MKSPRRLPPNNGEVVSANQRFANSIKTRKLETPVNYENTSVTMSENGTARVTVNTNNHSNNNNNSSQRNSPSILNNLRIYSPNKFSSDESMKSPVSSPSKSLDNTVIENKSDLSLRNCGEPPPLPPKPKVLPIKPSNWGQNGFPKKESVLPTERKGGLFLEQPTSSFV